ncbi:hypothetical protein E4N62_34765 [Streptomyces sp. MNU76]|uniref:hypothetical protein n=1 Tax=Streptomyces sp. MNU76 TaxID=2560026 RepID=UPI001E60645F|nr:hypothetical protein [Streptomyces sp. MNU76]MCC9709975.1 hypothetical protein [Streptomyces sp. MNU76]
MDPETALPLIELTAFGHGSGWSGPRFTRTAFGARLVHRGHRTEVGVGAGAEDGDDGHGGDGDGDWERPTVELHDPATGLTALVELSSPAGVAVLRSRVRLRNDGAEPLVVQSVSRLLLGGPPRTGHDLGGGPGTTRAGTAWGTAPARTRTRAWLRPVRRRRPHVSCC